MSSTTGTAVITVEIEGGKATIADIRDALDILEREGIPDTFEVKVRQWADRPTGATASLLPPPRPPKEQAMAETNNFCSFAEGRWEFLPREDAPVLICDTHGLPAEGAVYECDPGAEIGLCQETRDYVDEHTGNWPGPAGDRGAADETRCRCGRPVDRCHGRKDAVDILAELEAQRSVGADR